MNEKTISGVHVSTGSAEVLVRTGGKTNHHSIAYSHQHHFQKLPKSVDVSQNYSVQHQCRFLRHSIYTGWAKKIRPLCLTAYIFTTSN